MLMYMSLNTIIHIHAFYTIIVGDLKSFPKKLFQLL